MSQVQVTGALTSPITGLALSGASIKFTATESYGDVVEGSSATYVCDDDGGYDFSVYYGTYAVYLQTTGSWDYLGKAIVNDVSVSPSTLTVLIGTNTSPLTPTDIAYAEGLVASIEDSEAICAESASEALASAAAAASSATESSGFATQAKAYRDETSEISGLDTVTEAVDLALSETYQYAMTKAEFFALAEQRKRQYAGSGFIEWGKHYPLQDLVNEGIWRIGSYSNFLYLGTSPSEGVKEGSSNTDNPISLVNGVAHKLHNVATSSDRAKIIFPEAEQGTRSYDSDTGEITDYLTDVDPKYGDIAPDLEEALERNFEGVFAGATFDQASLSYATMSLNGRVCTVTATDAAQVPRVNLLNSLINDGVQSTVTVTCTSGYLAIYGTGFSSGSIFYISAGESFTDSNDMLSSLQIRVRSAEGIPENGDTCSFTVAIRSETSSVITSRQDYCFLESFHEKVSDKDIVVPHGAVQYGATSYEGITLSTMNALGTDRTYSGFGAWDEDTEGYGAQWSTLSDVQKKIFLDDLDNNLYFDSEAEELIQVRYRVRVVKGVGNSWNGVQPQKASRMEYATGATMQVSVQGERSAVFGGEDFASSTNFAYETIGGSLETTLRAKGVNEANIYASRRTDAYFSHDGLCFALPICLVQRGNQGAYHPVYNPYGFAFFGSVDTQTHKVSWFNDNQTTEDISSVRDTFIYRSTSSTGGGDLSSTAVNSTGNLPRQDQYKYHDAIYAGLVHDLRINANKQDPNRLMEDAIRKAVAGDTRGKGKQVYSTVYDNAGTYYDVNNDNTSSKWLRSANGSIFYVYADMSKISAEVGDWCYVYDATTGDTFRFKIETVNNNFLRMDDILASPNNFTHIAGGSVAGDSGTGNEVYYILEKELTPEYDSLPWVDIIGSPANIMATFPGGCVGQWLPTIPNGSTSQFPLNRKSEVTAGAALRTDNNGATWGRFGAGISATTNSWTASSNPSTNVALLYYTSPADFTELDDNTAVYGQLGQVFHSQWATATGGNRLHPSLVGNVGKQGVSDLSLYGFWSITGNSIATFNNALITNINGRPTHQPISYTSAPQNSGTDFKALYHLIEKDGLLHLQYHGREMQHDGTDWGDDSTIPIVDGESTMLDDNGTTVKTFTHTELFPIGIADYTETN